MNKAILISLAAVVVLIVIIALAALRFLRADDADPFDEAPDEPRRQPGRGHDDTRVRTAEPAIAGARRSAGRPAPAADEGWTGSRSDRGDQPKRPVRAERPERPVRADRPDRPARDSGFRERSTQDRPAEPDRRASQGGSRPQPVPAAARAAKPARSDRAGAKASDAPNWDSMSDVDYWTELAADKPFAPEPVPSPVSVTGSRRSPEQAAGARSATRGEPRGDQAGALPSRQSRSARAAAGRTAEFAAAPTESRPAHAPGRYAAEPATESIAALTRLANQGPAAPPAGGQSRNSQPHSTVERPAGPRPAPQRELLQREAPQRDAAQRPLPPRGPQLPPAQPHQSQPRQQVRPLPPAPLDDDPLTSPSFPAINTSDSRSYRTTGRADTSPGGSRGIPAYSEPTQQYAAYPDGPARSSSAPNGYPAQPAAPTGNPYGSFVGQPAASTPQPPVQDSGYATYDRQPAPAAGADSWYGGPMPGSAPVPPARHQAPADYLPGGMPPTGYDQSAYPAQPETAGYQQAGYVPGVSYEQGGYGAQDGAYGREAYQGYPGYGTGGY
jgi:hypothetical protein